VRVGDRDLPRFTVRSGTSRARLLPSRPVRVSAPSDGLRAAWSTIGAVDDIREYLVCEVGGWLHAAPDSPPAREVATRPDFWSTSELSHEELTRRIRSAGGVKRGYALEARTLRSGKVLLVHGCHRWAVANELGLPSVPVNMDHEVAPEHEAWPTWE
jgi:hypothetical protein